MQEETGPEKERKRLEKLERARSQAGWSEEWLHYNDCADRVAGRARDRFPVPAELVNHVQRVDGLAGRAFLAAAASVDEAAAARPVSDGRRRGRA